MNDVTEIVDGLKAKGIQFSDNLTEEELCRIETIYDIKFPKSLRCFYSHGIPFAEKDNCFPCWTNYSESNISEIKRRIQLPYDWLLKSVLREFWIPQWGERPKEQNEIMKLFIRISEKAPRLIPIFSHRYMPQLHNIDSPPVISTVGRDTIYYGSDLQDYLYHEFEIGCRCSTSKNLMYIPFWSDIIEYKM